MNATIMEAKKQRMKSVNTAFFDQKIKIPLTR